MPCLKFHTQRIKFTVLETNTEEFFDFLSAAGSPLSRRTFCVRWCQMVTKREGQSIVTTAASSMMCRSRGEVWSTRKGASSARVRVSLIEGMHILHDLRR